ncbi:MAG: alpha/beta fold hydrolase [Ignavibacteriaceae bacterium]|nr:alpha/beta fold hydrolase [Ignavibacteriaceae bacterium]
MKIFSSLLFSLLFTINSYSQYDNITGIWKGTLQASTTKLDLIIKIDFSKDPKAVMDVPAQGIQDFVPDSVSFNGEVFYFKGSNPNFVLFATYLPDEDKFIGKFIQGGEVDITLERFNDYTPIRRSQEPKPPFPYYSFDTNFKNTNAGIELAGTITVPDTLGIYPAVVLVSGSGPQDRDESLLGHKPFLVLADFLSRNGFAVLRYDDRGTAKSKGNFSTANTFDFAEDAVSAVNHLRTFPFVDSKSVGLIGHSEGGIIAVIVASRYDVCNFVVSLAGTAINGAEIILLQTELMMLAEGIDSVQVKLVTELSKQVLHLAVTDTLTFQGALNNLVKDYSSKLTEDERVLLEKSNYLNPNNYRVFGNIWMKTFLSYDPAVDMQKIKIPFLGLWGEKDLQVPAIINYEKADKALKESESDYNLYILDGLNHLFQLANTGSSTEYSIIEETFNENALNKILDWLIKTTKK